MKLKVIPTNSYKKDVKNIKKRSDFNISLLNNALKQVVSSSPSSFKTMKGRYSGAKEIRITGDYRLIFELNYDENYLRLIRVGTHSDLFR